MRRRKIVGTFAPINALFSQKQKKQDRGTFETGFEFLKWLKKTKQTAWQLLPLHETKLEAGSAYKHVPSPYQTYGIGLDPKLLPASFKKRPNVLDKDEFIKKNNWVLDYSLFCALRDHFKTDNWTLWDEKTKKRDKKTLTVWRGKLKDEIDYYIVQQWQLNFCYELLKSKAKQIGIKIVGDMPFYLPLESPLVWAAQNAFKIEKDFSLRYVSGVPFVPGVHFGRQIWGQPLYDWESKANLGKILNLWKIRLKYLSNLYDLIRLDHARGFFEYGVMDTKNAQKDSFKDGPGSAVFAKLVAYARNLGLSIFAEDSGEARLVKLNKSLKKLSVPGIKVLYFGLSEETGAVDMDYADVASYPEDVVAYSTTHDTKTLIDYLQSLKPGQKIELGKIVKTKYDGDDKKFVKNLINALLDSRANTVIIPIQDWLLMPDRINIPGTERPLNDPNWQFSLKIPIEDLPTKF
jgi:4-alpha-glucanotransferase